MESTLRLDTVAYYDCLTNNTRVITYRIIPIFYLKYNGSLKTLSFLSYIRSFFQCFPTRSTSMIIVVVSFIGTCRLLNFEFVRTKCISCYVILNPLDLEGKSEILFNF